MEYLFISVKTVWRRPAMHPEYSLKLCRMDCQLLLFYLTRALLSSVIWVSGKVQVLAKFLPISPR
jgi:hypothetical protein